MQAATVILIKYAALSIEGESSIFKIVWNVFYISSLVLFVLRALFWQIVLLQNSISSFYPMLSLNYVVLLIFSYLLFSEQILWNNSMGVLVIIFGVYLTARK
jgi:drug/metabolite transporter (DMT)-like permease